MSNTTYATLSDVKTRMPNITDTSRDTAIQGYLNTAARLLDKTTRRGIEGQEVFTESSSGTRYYDDLLLESGGIEINDLLTISSLTRAGSTIDTAYYYLHPYNPGTGPYTCVQILPQALPFSLARYYNFGYAYTQLGGDPYVYPYHEIGLKGIGVTGIWGYCMQANRPPEILEATCIQAIRMYERANLRTADVLAAVVNPFRQLDPFVYELIEAYIRDPYGSK